MYINKLYLKKYKYYTLIIKLYILHVPNINKVIFKVAKLGYKCNYFLWNVLIDPNEFSMH